jgi:hypothetical protein
MMATKAPVVSPQLPEHIPDRLPGINREARVIGRSELEISAPREHVWAVLTDFDHWPTWNADVKSMHFEESVAPGSKFRWKAGPGTIASVIARVEPPGLIAWTGKTLGIKAIHVWVLEPHNGQTLVRTEESYDGLPARIFRASMQKTLDGALARGLRYLKAEIERQGSAHPHTRRPAPSRKPLPSKAGGSGERDTQLRSVSRNGSAPETATVASLALHSEPGPKPA